MMLTRSKTKKLKFQPDPADSFPLIGTMGKLQQIMPDGMGRKASKRDLIPLSDNIWMFRNKKLTEHNTIYLGEMRSKAYGSRSVVIKLARYTMSSLSEAKILLKLNESPHRLIVLLFHSDIFQYGFEEYLYIVLEKCHDENLRQFIINRKRKGCPFDPNHSIGLAQQIVFGLEFIHSKKIIHKDLKPDNILFSLDQSVIRISDFSLSEEIDSFTARVFKEERFGTYGYGPFECFGNGVISLKTDIFSLGVTLYYVMSNGEHPFGDVPELWNYNIKKDVGLDLSRLLVSNANTMSHLVKCMLSFKRCNRPTIWEVLSHPCWTGNEVVCDFDYKCEESVEVEQPPFYASPENSIDQLHRFVEAFDNWQQTGASALKTAFASTSKAGPTLKTIQPLEHPATKAFVEDEVIQDSLWQDQDQSLAAVLKQSIATEAVREHIIGPTGGSAVNHGCKITFPPKAVEKKAKIKTSVITDFSDSPEGMVPITPILECIMNGTLKALVLVEMQSWACSNHRELQGRLCRKDQKSEWKSVENVSLSSDATFSFSTLHFTRFGVFTLVEAAQSRIYRMIGLTLQTKNLLHINRDGEIAFVCCFSHPKVIEDVESSLAKRGYIHSLLLPEAQEVSRDGKLSVGITCHNPRTLKIRECRNGVMSSKRQCVRTMEVSKLSRNIQCHEYFPLKIGSKNLMDHEGEIEVSFSLKNGGSIEHTISKQWPLPIRKEKRRKTVHKHKTEMTAHNIVTRGGRLRQTLKGSKTKVTKN